MMMMMMRCEHSSCWKGEKVWLPCEARERKIGLKAHPYCINCGAIKNISSDRPRKIGYYVNVISHISRNYRISDAQIRLIVNELDGIEDFEDLYWTTGKAQEIMFINAVKKYSNLPELTIRAFLC